MAGNDYNADNELPEIAEKAKVFLYYIANDRDGKYAKMVPNKGGT